MLMSRSRSATKNESMKTKLKTLMTLAALGSISLLAADVDMFLKRSDGEVIGILATNKTSVALTGTIKEVTWTANNGFTRVFRWDGTNITIAP